MATALELGVALDVTGQALEGFAGSFGRVETIPVGGRDVSILLIKNPAGANEVLRTLILEDGELDLWLALNDRTADGRDVSWIWDADFELLAGRVRRAVCSGTRAEEMALRLKYAGLDAELEVNRELGPALDDAVAGAAGQRAVRPAHLHRAARAARSAGPARAGPQVVGVIDRSVIWHDVENGSYSADLDTWLRLAAEAEGPVLDLGAGTGRIALALAADGQEVTALESDPFLLDELGRRARDRELSVARWLADARELTPIEGFALVIAPMQFMQILGGSAERGEVLRRVAACLRPGGAFAAAISNLDEAVAADDATPPLPDVGERRGWVYSSLPLDVRPEPGGVAVEWLRQVVSPAGELTEERYALKLDSLTPGQLEEEAARHGLRPEARLRVDSTESHVGSTVVLCRR